MHEDATTRNGTCSVDERIDTPVELTLDALGMGTWDWYISSGTVLWSPRTYQLFGLQPDAGPAPSYDLLLKKYIYEGDRLVVARAGERACRERGRIAIEFRIVRADDHRIRWVRSTGRVIADGAGRVLHMVGVLDDVTEEKEREKGPEGEPGIQAFSTRQLARLLGIAEGAVKRLAAEGAIETLRSSRKDSRRFAPEHVLEYLRRSAGDAEDFAAAAQARDLDAALVALLTGMLAGKRLEDLLDEMVRPCVHSIDGAFLRDLLERAAFLGVERQHSIFPALLARAGMVRSADGEFVRCLLRSRGHDVLTPADGHLAQLVDVAARIRARVVVFLLGRDADLEGAVAAASGIARSCRASAVCLWSEAEVRPRPGVARIRSMRELAAVLRRS